MPLSGRGEKEEEPAAEKERAREEDVSSGQSVRERCLRPWVHSRNVHASVATGEEQRSMMFATVTVMEEEVLELVTLVLLQEDVDEEL